jgi:hypothetical protein
VATEVAAPMGKGENVIPRSLGDEMQEARR